MRIPVRPWRRSGGVGEKEKEEKREKKEKREKRSQQSMGNPLPFPLIFAFLPPLLGPSHHFFSDQTTTARRQH